MNHLAEGAARKPYNVWSDNKSEKIEIDERDFCCVAMRLIVFRLIFIYFNGVANNYKQGLQWPGRFTQDVLIHHREVPIIIYQ